MTLRWPTGAIFGALLSACGPTAPGTIAVDIARCEQTASQEVALLAATPDYVVETRAFDGPKPANIEAAAILASNPCANATVMLTVRRIEDGAFVHGFVSSMNRMDLIEGHAGPPFDGAKLATFLGEWAKVTVATTDAAPSGVVATTLDAAAYAEMQAKKAPMLCHAANVHERACFSIDAEDPYTLTPFFTEDQS